jgi:hypothetical protein
LFTTHKKDPEKFEDKKGQKVIKIILDKHCFITRGETFIVSVVVKIGGLENKEKQFECSH